MGVYSGVGAKEDSSSIVAGERTSFKVGANVGVKFGISIGAALRSWR